MKTAESESKDFCYDPPVEIKPVESPQPSGPSPDNRFGSRGVTTGRLLGAFAVIGSLIIFGESWYTLFVLELAAVYICSEVLVSRLPVSITNSMKWNCVRLDGSWSAKRERIERQAIAKLRWDLRMILLLILIPTTILIWLVDREVFPLNVGMSAMASIRSTEEGWKDELADEDRGYDRWSKGKVLPTLFGLNAEQYKRFFWYFWPAAILTAVGWIFGCWVAVSKMFLYQLNELARDIRLRKTAYSNYDEANLF